MFVLALRHRVADYDAWRQVWEQRLDARLAGKVTGHRLARQADDPEVVEVVMEFATRADAEAYREYMERPETREALARGGVEEHASMWIGEVVDAATY